MTEIPEGRSALELDVDVRRHLAMLLTGAQCGTDDQVVALARMETHRLVGAVIAGLRNHELRGDGVCTVCGEQFACCEARSATRSSRSGDCPRAAADPAAPQGWRGRRFSDSPPVPPRHLTQRTWSSHEHSSVHAVRRRRARLE